MLEGKHYKINARNLACHELIGLSVRVKESTAKERVGTEGKVLNETKNTFIVDSKGKRKVLPKNECTFEFDIKEKVVMDGKKLVKRPEDRVKEWRN